MKGWWINAPVPLYHRLRTVSANTPETALSPLDTAVRHMRALHAQGRYQEALDACLQVAHTYPESAEGWGGAAVNCTHLGQWQDAIRYAQTALARGGNMLGIYDALAHVHGHLRQWDEARRYGRQALEMRARRFSSEPVIPLAELPPMPPPPSAQTHEHNLIAFSLFGRDPKYCEAAVFNVQEQPDVYPHWVCRFYVDDSVPGHVISRLKAGGGQVVPVEGAALQWPGPMWRLLALDDPQAHRILFRDADSVISRREAGAVGQWIASGKRFHMMRDWGSHTELIHAGLWGAVGGSLPPLGELMARFMSAPLASRHFADQYFLRQYVWPYACASLMQHDSVFGFMDAAPFPEVEERSNYFHVGCLGSVPFTAKINAPDGAKVAWALYLIDRRADGQTGEEQVCSYRAVIQNGTVTVHIPMRYARRVQQGTARLTFV
jgi:hypothetical protein